MSNLTTKFILSVALVVLGGISAAHASIIPGSQIRFNIQNAFILNDKTYAPGEYTISATPSTADSPYLLILRGDNGETAIFDTTSTTSADAAKDTELVFDKIGDEYFLSKIWVKGDTNGNAIARSKSQKQLMSQNLPSQTVILALRRS